MEMSNKEFYEWQQDCPGPASESAGKGSACEGCPNQSLCASGVSKSFNEGVEKIESRLSNVKRKVAVLSGKGGVGKSTVTCLLARYLASQSANNVAVLDVDICGPSMPRLLGVANEEVHMSGSGWCPVYVEENLAVMSVGFLLKDPDEAVVWRGNRKTNMIRDMVSEVDWGSDPIDWLLLDTPPGTSDEHISLGGLLRTSGLAAVLVSTPQEVALLDVRKEIDFCRKMAIPVLGVIENMSSFVCTHCNVESSIFPAKSGGVARMAQEMGVEYLGRVGLDPRLTRALDEGSDPSQHFRSPALAQLPGIVTKIQQAVDKLIPI